MGRTTTTHKYEITPEMRELQEMAGRLHVIGWNINVDITQDLITINNVRKYTYKTGREEMVRLLESAKDSKGILSYPDREQEAKDAKAEAKRQKKHREPGAPAELKTVIRRAKRIYKKTYIKIPNSADASLKATQYLEKRLEGEDLPIAAQHLLNYIAKERA